MAAQEIPVSGYPSRLLSRVEVAEGTMAFHFEKPRGFDFTAGAITAGATMTNLSHGSTDDVCPCARRQAIMLGKHSDERKTIRALLTAPVVVVSEGNRHLGLVRDLSLGGVFIYTDFEPSCDLDLQLIIRLTKDGSTSLACRGRVVRVVRGAPGSAYGVAVQAKEYELGRVAVVDKS